MGLAISVIAVTRPRNITTGFVVMLELYPPAISEGAEEYSIQVLITDNHSVVHAFYRCANTRRQPLEFMPCLR